MIIPLDLIKHNWKNISEDNVEQSHPRPLNIFKGEILNTFSLLRRKDVLQVNHDVYSADNILVTCPVPPPTPLSVCMCVCVCVCVSVCVCVCDVYLFIKTFQIFENLQILRLEMLEIWLNFSFNEDISGI